jgi:hypothetical protein
MWGWLAEQEEQHIDKLSIVGLEVGNYMESNPMLKGDSIMIEDSIRQMQKFTQNLAEIEKGDKLELLVGGKVITLTKCKGGNIQINQ